MPPSDTPTPGPACGPQAQYTVIATAGVTMVPGDQLVPASHCDDCILGVTIPFPYDFYGQTYTNVNVSSNGNLPFTTSNPQPRHVSDASQILDNAALLHWDDLDMTNPAACAGGCGVCTSTTGVSPTRIFNIEWHAVYKGSSEPVNFVIRLYEGQTRFDVIYGQVALRGGSATIGVRGPTSANTTIFSCDNPQIVQGLQLSFIQSQCPTPTATATPPVTPSATATNTATPAAGLLVGHVLWQGRSPSPDPLNRLPLTLTLQMGATRISYANQQTDASGVFTVPVGTLPSGQRRRTVKMSALPSLGSVGAPGNTGRPASPVRWIMFFTSAT